MALIQYTLLLLVVALVANAQRFRDGDNLENLEKQSLTICPVTPPQPGLLYIHDCDCHWVTIRFLQSSIGCITGYQVYVSGIGYVNTFTYYKYGSYVYMTIYNLQHPCPRLYSISVRARRGTAYSSWRSNAVRTCSSDDGVRLLGSTNYKIGRLEVFYEGAWGTVCDDVFGQPDARVACNQLGYGFRGQKVTNAYGYGVGIPIWLDNMACTGTQASLHVCSHAAWGVHNCLHSEDVAVNCVLARSEDDNEDGDDNDNENEGNPPGEDEGKSEGKLEELLGEVKHLEEEKMLEAKEGIPPADRDDKPPVY